MLVVLQTLVSVQQWNNHTLMVLLQLVLMDKLYRIPMLVWVKIQNLLLILMLMGLELLMEHVPMDPVSRIIALLPSQLQVALNLITILKPMVALLLIIHNSWVNKLMVLKIGLHQVTRLPLYLQIPSM